MSSGGSLRACALLRLTGALVGRRVVLLNKYKVSYLVVVLTQPPK